mgnify:CR=1 FL=1
MTPEQEAIIALIDRCLERGDTIQTQQQEIGRLKADALDHDCPTFPLCPAHTDTWTPYQAPDCPYCDLAALRPQVTALEGEVSCLKAETVSAEERDQWQAETEQLTARWAKLKKWVAAQGDSAYAPVLSHMAYVDVYMAIAELEAKR